MKIQRVASMAATLLFAATLAHAQAGAGRLPYHNPSLPTEQRVEDLLGRMTLEEKVGQMMSIWSAKRLITDAQGRFDPARAPEWFRVGIGRIERPSDGHGARAQAEYTNAIQRWVKQNTRLGIPVIFHEEALHGLQGVEATSFPQSIALASSWNPELVESIFGVVAGEVRARGAQQVLAPIVDIAREPRWGRFEETYGEDPYLTSRLGVAAVRGFQGRGPTIPDDRVIATLKHMTGHGQPESGTNVGPAPFGESTLRNFFFPPFEAAVREAGARSLMPSYNEIDGVPSHVNRWMLNDVLRGEWGFDGVIVSDWQAIEQLVSRHRVARDSAEAARRALAATVDVELPDVETYHTLVRQVREGRVPQAAIDTAVRRLLRDKFQLGLFENPYVDPARAERIAGAAENRPLALEAARQSIVLLKNQNNALPLQAERLQRVAVIGPHAGEVMLGGYSGVPEHSVSILEGIRNRLGPGGTVEYAEGVRLTEDSVFTSGPQPLIGGTRSQLRWSADRVVPADSAENLRRIAQAVEVARRSDVAILVVGGNEQTSREAYAENHLGDRTDIDLFGQQEELVRAVLATGKPVVLVLQNGRPVSIPELAERVPAIVEGWYLGQEGGTAMAEVLFGDYNPGGKLPVTVARGVGHLPHFYNHKPTARRGYLLETTEPLFPFGHGLSYTTFSYSEPRLSTPRIPATGRVQVAVDVTNTGARAGDEVVQLYIRDQFSDVTRPVKELKGFQRISLQPGQTRTVTFELGPAELRYWYDPVRQWVVEPGTFEIMVGGSSADAALKRVELEVVEEAPVAASTPLRELARRRGIGIGSVADRSFRPGGTEDPRFRATLAREFNVLTPENDLKFQRLRPARGEYDFTRADSLLAFAEANDMRLRGHTLVWHRQLAPWLTEHSWTPQQAEAQLAEHIATVAGRYRGRLMAWDVVNEAIDDDASPRKTFWSENVGPDYIEKAFRMAHAADPEVPLFYNDYGIEGINAKSDAVYALVRELKARGVPIHGIGFQAHMRAGSGPSREEMAANFKRFSDLGLKIQVTELDVRVRQPTTPEGLEAQARTYRDVMEACLGNAACDTVVLWGFTDADSWIPGWNPGWGDALPFDAEYRPKPAYQALQQTLGRS